MSKNQWLMVMLPPLLILSMVPDLGKLAIFSLLAQLSNLVAFVVVFWFDFKHLHLATNYHEKEFSLRGLPFFFSAAIYCYEGAGIVLSVEESLCDSVRSKFKRIFVATLSAVTFLYLAFGASGYLSYGPYTKDIITLNLPRKSSNLINFAALVKACLCFSLFFTYPVMLFPISAMLERAFKVPNLIKKTVIRVFLVGSTGIVVVLIPKFADLMALVGATCCTLLTFILPGLMHLILFRKELTKAQLVVDYLMVAIGVIGSVLGTWDALIKVFRIELGSSNHPPGAIVSPLPS